MPERAGQTNRREFMSNKPVPFSTNHRIHRNDDGTWSVLCTRPLRLVKPGFTSHAEAKQWCEEQRLEELKRGEKKSAAGTKIDWGTT